MINPFALSSYDYFLPNELIASTPLSDKNSAKVLVYDRAKNKIIHSKFGEILNFLPPNTSVVLNDTKVVKARIFGKKLSGGGVELLLNTPLQDNLFSVYIKGRVKQNSIIIFEKNLKAEVVEIHEDGLRVVKFSIENEMIDTSELFDILEIIGHIPLPPYIKRDDNEDDIINYQSVFAKNRGAVAAPTASLHFSDAKFEELKKRFNTKKVTLHVGAGTFKPITCEDVSEHKMHQEYFNIDKETCDLIESQSKILAVGTTVTRTIEEYARNKQKSGYCDLFLSPSNKPIRVNHLLTNFHLPKSTLIMLVSSFVGIEKTLELYKIAIKERYRFFSYGDAMLII